MPQEKQKINSVGDAYNFTVAVQEIKKELPMFIFAAIINWEGRGNLLLRMYLRAKMNMDVGRF